MEEQGTQTIKRSIFLNNTVLEEIQKETQFMETFSSRLILIEKCVKGKETDNVVTRYYNVHKNRMFDMTKKQFDKAITNQINKNGEFTF